MKLNRKYYVAQVELPCGNYCWVEGFYYNYDMAVKSFRRRISDALSMAVSECNEIRFFDFDPNESNLTAEL